MMRKHSSTKIIFQNLWPPYFLKQLILTNRFGASRPAIWPQEAHLWPFGAVLRPHGAPQWPFRTREMVPTHPPGCVLTWSNLDPRRSAISEPPGQLMATRGPFMAIWTVFGHKMGKNGWIKSMSIWIKTLLNPTNNLHSLVFTKRQLRNSPPP